MRRHRAAPPPKTPSTPKLVLAAFQSPATIDFGEQHPEKEAVKTLVLSCPADAKRSATVEVVRTPTNITARFEGGAQSITIERGDVAACALTWRPERPGALRGAVAFRLDGKRRSARRCWEMRGAAAAAAQKGDAPAGGPCRTGRRAAPRRSSASRRGRIRRAEPPRRTWPSRETYGDFHRRRFSQSVARRVISWCFIEQINSTKRGVRHAQKSERRRRCAAVWRSESLTEARKNVVEEVAANRLVLRPELDVRCDQVLRAHVLGLFASIEGPWLKAALDAALPLRGDGSLKAQLADHFFGDAETALRETKITEARTARTGAFMANS